MIFNHNIAQRSDRIIFDNGYTHEKLGGGFFWSFGGVDENARPIIGDTIRLYADGRTDLEIGAYSLVYLKKSVDLTNVKRIHVKCECEVWCTKEYVPYLNIGVFEENTNSGHYTDLNGNYSVKATRFPVIPDTSVVAPNQTYHTSWEKDTPMTLDVSDLDGEYKFAIAAVAYPGNKDVKPITADIYRIWLE